MMLPTPNPSVIYRALSEGAVLFSVTEEVYFGLNPVAAEVWELLPPVHSTIDALCDILTARHPDVPADQLVADVTELLDSLHSFGLLIPPEGARHAALHETPVEAGRA
ncbi:MAG: PqqD family protein [Gemmatimonadaceae bacterium]